MCGIKERARAGQSQISALLSVASHLGQITHSIKKKKKKLKHPVSSSPDLPHSVVRIN